MSMDINITTSFYDGKGIKRVKVTGGHQIPGRFSEDPISVFRLEFFLNSYPTPDETPLFFAELEAEDVMNLRNTLSAILFSQGQQ
jgi:hypothetical protein